MCLSPRVTMDQNQELINPFVSETKESACICICIVLLLKSSWLYNTYVFLKGVSVTYLTFDKPCKFVDIKNEMHMRLKVNKRQWKCPWCNGYHRRKWTRWHEFKSWTRPIAFHIALIPLGKVWIQLFSLQLRVNSRIDLVRQIVG